MPWQTFSWLRNLLLKNRGSASKICEAIFHVLNFSAFATFTRSIPGFWLRSDDFWSPKFEVANPCHLRATLRYCHQSRPNPFVHRDTFLDIVYGIEFFSTFFSIEFYRLCYRLCYQIDIIYIIIWIFTEIFQVICSNKVKFGSRQYEKMPRVRMRWQRWLPMFSYSHNRIISNNSANKIFLFICASRELNIIILNNKG